jgi:hypothetical protein
VTASTMPTVSRAARPSRRRRIGALLGVALILAGLLSACQSTPDYVVAGCTPADRGGRSVARAWDDAALEMIRQVVPAPTVHARNLFHLSAAMWDAWAAYDPTSDGYFVIEKPQADDATAAREAAISFAAYRILLWRYATVSDLKTAPDALAEVMAGLCYRPDYTSTTGDSPAALGNRIAAAVLEAGRIDGAHEDERYQDAAYASVNDPLVVAESGTTMRDPNRWQPLALAEQVSQNGIPIPGSIQSFIGPHWGHVASFGLPDSDTGTPIDPGLPPRLGTATDQAFKDQAVEVIRLSAELDPTDPTTVDISPGAMGGSSIGANDGTGHALNPATGEPYASNVVLRADYNRVLAEYWADGPKSETPPGHWNVIANQVADSPGFAFRMGGAGEPLGRLEWDVKVYFALNGALHDAAIATWGAKGFYDSARPISMIRYMGGKGQSSDPSAPSYDPHGLPLVEGLIEVITPASSGPGERHAALAGAVGKIAIRAWNGFPEDPTTQTSGVGWILAEDWVPYQRPTFVTPGFAGYPSGHSTFSRAGAQVMTALTGDPYFPGGMTQITVQAGDLLHEEGPTQDVTIQWATYGDAADAAGLSRLRMGIHIAADDLEGRIVGATCGDTAVALAQTYFDGSARP